MPWDALHAVVERESILVEPEAFKTFKSLDPARMSVSEIFDILALLVETQGRECAALKFKVTNELVNTSLLNSPNGGEIVELPDPANATPVRSTKSPLGKVHSRHSRTAAPTTPTSDFSPLGDFGPPSPTKPQTPRKTLAPVTAITKDIHSNTSPSQLAMSDAGKTLPSSPLPHSEPESNPAISKANVQSHDVSMVTTKNVRGKQKRKALSSKGPDAGDVAAGVDGKALQPPLKKPRTKVVIPPCGQSRRYVTYSLDHLPV